MADEEGSGHGTLTVVVGVVAVVVVVWFVLGLLHFLASLIWGAVEVIGLVALVVLVGWLLFRRSDD
jgi:hypothetical protein